MRSEKLIHTYTKRERLPQYHLQVEAASLFYEILIIQLVRFLL